MDESAQQAVQLGVNVTIFIIALTIGITLMLGVRDVAEKAFEYNASIPTGSRVISVANDNRRVISGDEILSYYSNYMTDENHALSDKFIIKVENKSGTRSITKGPEGGTSDLKDYLKHKGIDISKNYEIIISEYDKNNEILKVTLKEID